jgi:hypothetical protein
MYDRHLSNSTKKINKNKNTLTQNRHLSWQNLGKESKYELRS